MKADAAEAIVMVLKTAEEIALTSHVNPDGDSIGSLLGLSIALSSLGKRIWAAIPGKGLLPPQYKFMPGQDLLVPASSFPERPPVFVALDCGNIERLYSLKDKALNAGQFVNIDHHVDNTLFAKVNLIRPEASSTSEIVFGLLKQAEIHVRPEAALSFYVGLMTDSGRFQHDNTNPATFRAAAELVDLGAEPHRAAHEVYENQSLEYMRLIGRTLIGAGTIQDLQLVYSYVSQRDLAETGAVMEETEDLIDILRIARGTRIAVLMKELEDGQVRVSLRSADDVDIAWIARKHGGGGHARAAGFTSPHDHETTLKLIEDELRSN